MPHRVEPSAFDSQSFVLIALLVICFPVMLLWKKMLQTKLQIANTGKGLDTCYSATYMSQTRDQQRFTISEVAADGHEPMVPQRIMWPSIAGAQRTTGPTVQLADTPSPQSATPGLHSAAVATTHFPSR